jgi:hypothetical protein
MIHAASSDAASVTVFFPDRDRSRLTEGLVIRIENPSNPRHAYRARLVSVDAEPMSLTLALAKLGIAAWPDARPPSRLAVVGASLENESPTTVKADEVVAADAPIGKESLLTLLLPALRSARED